MELGAVPLVMAATSNAAFFSGSPLQSLIIRKKPKGFGTDNDLEGKDNLAPGRHILLVDDVATTGSSLLKSIERLEYHDYKVVDILCIVDRMEGASELLSQHGYQLNTLFNRHDLLPISD